MTAAREVLLLEPILLPKIWGGTRFTDPAAPGARIGEAMLVSGRTETDTVVAAGPRAGIALSRLWETEPALFGEAAGTARPARFPFQVKLIDAGDDLSVQVHPGAPSQGEQSAGTAGESKNECWFVLEPSTDGTIVIGHQATTRDELLGLVEQERWGQLLSRRPMRTGDFYFIPAGTAHCILAGSLIYEIMEPSDTTYRFHDHGRVDEHGRPRETHLAEAVTVLNVPDTPEQPVPAVRRLPGAVETTLVDHRCFRVRLLEVDGSHATDPDTGFFVATVLEGEGAVLGTAVSSGQTFMVTAGDGPVTIDGQLRLIVTDR